MKKRWLLIAIIIILTNGFLAAKQDVTILSSYDTADFLQFQYGPPPIILADEVSNISSFIDSSDFCAHLGTLTLWTDGKNLFNPTLINLTVSPDVFIEGYVRDPQTGTIIYKNNIEVTVMAISVVNYQVISSVVLDSGNIQIAPTGNVLPGQVSTMKAYIVMVVSNMGYEYFIPGVSYSLDDGSTIGTFGVSVDGQGNQEFTEIPVSVDETGETTVAPFIPAAPGPGDDVEIPFEGDGFPFEHQYAFSIISNPASFDLQDALLGNRPVIATVELQVTQAEQNTEYGVEIAFTSKNPNGFRLHLNGDLSLYGIPYQLFFGQDLQPIPHAQFIEWRNLLTNSSTFASMEKTITVSVNDGPELGEAPQGQYSDTVTVNIIPLDILSQ